MILGTAQLGSTYGIVNKVGQPLLIDAFDILDIAVNNGVLTVDTAPGYGNSESIIGEYLSNNKKLYSNLKIISKLPKIDNGLDPSDFIKISIEKTMSNIGINTLDFYLLHDEENLNNPSIIKTMFKIKADNYTRKIGVSVYTVESAYKAIDCGFDTLQIPVNLFDQRFIEESFIEKCKNYNVTVMARSIYLQGLFFCDDDDLPGRLKDGLPFIKRVDNLCKQYKLSTSELALGFVKSIKTIDYIIIGAETAKQTENSIHNYNQVSLEPNVINKVKNSFNDLPKHIIDPRTWKG